MHIHTYYHDLSSKEGRKLKRRWGFQAFNKRFDSQKFVFKLSMMKNKKWNKIKMPPSSNNAPHPHSKSLKAKRRWTNKLINCNHLTLQFMGPGSQHKNNILPYVLRHACIFFTLTLKLINYLKHSLLIEFGII